MSGSRIITFGSDSKIPWDSRGILVGSWDKKALALASAKLVVYTYTCIYTYKCIYIYDIYRDRCIYIVYIVYIYVWI